jgi:hypothetical protein
MSGKMRRNGILAAPTAMVNYVLPFALGATALGLRDEIPQIRKDAPKVARALQADVRRFEGYGLRKGFIRDPQFGGEVPGYRAKIQVDLSDLGPTYPWREMQRLNPEIELYVLLKAKPNQTGAFRASGVWAKWASMVAAPAKKRSKTARPATSASGRPTADHTENRPPTPSGNGNTCTNPACNAAAGRAVIATQ